MAPSLDDNGITGGDFDAYGANRTIPRAMTAFAAIAWYNTIEIMILSAFVFKKHAGLYFWSVIVCAISICIYSTGAWLYQNVSSVSKPVADALMTVGWVVMIPSQSIVLWSRLHMITHNKRLLRFLLWMIIINSIVLIIPTCVFNWGALLRQEPPFLRGYTIIEKIQMCVFTTQEILISGVYLWEVRKVVIGVGVREKQSRSMIKQLVLMNVAIIVLDVVTLATEFCEWFMIQVTLKGLVYSVKLKLEFAVLSQIINLVLDKRSDSQRAVDEAAAAAAKHDALSSPAILLRDPEKHAITPHSLIASPMRSSRSNSSDMITEDRIQSFERGRQPSCGGSMLPGLQLPEIAAELSLDDEEGGRYVRSLQQNVPTNWRLSIGHEALSGPNLYEIRQLSQSGYEPDQSSIESSENVSYPGRLG